MTTQHQAAELYRDAQAAAADAWEQVVDHQTAYMHSDRRYDPQAADDAAQLEALADWNRRHPHARPLRLGAVLAGLGALCLYAVGLVGALWSVYQLATGHDNRWLAGVLLGALLVELVRRGTRKA